MTITIDYNEQVEKFSEIIFEQWKNAYFGGAQLPYQQTSIQGVAMALGVQFDYSQVDVYNQLYKEVENLIENMEMPTC